MSRVAGSLKSCLYKNTDSVLGQLRPVDKHYLRRVPRIASLMIFYATIGYHWFFHHLDPAGQSSGTMFSLFNPNQKSQWLPHLRGWHEVSATWIWSWNEHWLSLTSLVGGLVAIFYLPINIGFLIIPIDELIFFRGVAQPPTSDETWNSSRFWNILAPCLDSPMLCLKLWLILLVKQRPDPSALLGSVPLWAPSINGNKYRYILYIYIYIHIYICIQ